MFKAIQHNIIESDEGFSIEIHWQDRIIYRKQGRVLIVHGERLVYLKEKYGYSQNKYGFQIFLKSMNHWEKPHENETIDQSTKESIIGDIARALEFIDSRCETDRPPTIEELNERYRDYRKGLGPA
jgi:Immunity protein 74